MSADTDAFKTVQSLPLTDAERQYLLTVARGEGFYGLGWGNNPATLKKSEEMGIDGKAGVGSNNWGAVQGIGNAGSFPHVDYHSDGSPYIGNYRKYKTSADGAADMARILLKPNLKAALNSGIYIGPKKLPDETPLSGMNLGPLKAAVYTQHDNRYFELNPDKYLSAVSKNYEKLTAALQWPRLLDKKESAVPLAGSPSLESSGESSGSPLPEAGFLRGQKYSVPGIQDESSKK